MSAVRFREAPYKKTVYNLLCKPFFYCPQANLFTPIFGALGLPRLSCPDIPLHNNESERDIREYVKKRKISGSTRSDDGRRCRDTFISLKKTCRKLKIPFWEYIKDRILKINKIPPLPDIIRQRALGT